MKTMLNTAKYFINFFQSFYFSFGIFWYNKYSAAHELC